MIGIVTVLVSIVIPFIRGSRTIGPEETPPRILAISRSRARQQTADDGSLRGLSQHRPHRSTAVDPDQWIATVNKMVNWGAQVSSAEQTQLVNYLAARYHPGASGSLEQTMQDSLETTITEPTTHPGVPQHPDGRPDHGQRLFGQNCVPCHGPAAAGGMGPKLAKNPILTDERRFWEPCARGEERCPRGAHAERARDFRYSGMAEDA